MQLGVIIANRHLDLRQTLFVEDFVLRDHLVQEEQVGRQRINLIGGESPLIPGRHAAFDVIHTVVANGERSGRIRSRCQMGTSWPFFDCNSGAIPPRPAGPWQAMHPFCSKTCAPSLAVPRPGGSSSPVGPIEISMRRISSAVGVRPTPYVGDCANA